MKTALMQGNVDTAVSFFTSTQQDRYRTLFTALGSSISQIAANMQDIQLIYLEEGVAKYRLPRDQIYGGQATTFVYYVYFVQDGSGIWNLHSF